MSEKKSKSIRSILFIFPYPSGTAASQRFRFEQYLDFLPENDLQYQLAPFMDEETWKILYKPGNSWKKIKGIIKGFLRRIGLLFSVHKYDFVFIHREATPVGPPFIEWIIAKVFRKRIIFDFDDAIWLPNTSENNSIVAGIKWHHKTKSICQWAWKISAGNRYLADFAKSSRKADKREEKSVIVNPTTIDTKNLHNRVKEQDTDSFVIGWTGTHSTIGYLESLLPVLKKLEEDYSFTFLVISDRKPDFNLKSLQYIPWTKATEANDLLRMNVGVMPLRDDQWSRGKCGFKALQYMSLGIPALASPVGVNADIIQHGTNGFLCSEPHEWIECIKLLIHDVELRTTMGKSSRDRIEKQYSVAGNKENFIRLFTV
ncbi:glycosyltransferase [Cytophagaceae bacterium YF14B1]|uniref:Glycosyltransferase n=1 Tax=Xanthocytophaga flava TaxID=3048013 RepID=A0AAE3QW89_9BACT|nr:glycosyltransferase [Xanthocytophaga flavus]MDJ1484361.1 glycosyltransferase [Xanthocytophaga flavus]